MVVSIVSMLLMSTLQVLHHCAKESEKNLDQKADHLQNLINSSFSQAYLSQEFYKHSVSQSVNEFY